MLLPSSYRYSVIPGGLKRSKIRSRIYTPYSVEQTKRSIPSTPDHMHRNGQVQGTSLSPIHSQSSCTVSGYLDDCSHHHPSRHLPYSRTAENSLNYNDSNFIHHCRCPSPCGRFEMNSIPIYRDTRHRGASHRYTPGSPDEFNTTKGRPVRRYDDDPRIRSLERIESYTDNVCSECIHGQHNHCDCLQAPEIYPHRKLLGAHASRARLREPETAFRNSITFQAAASKLDEVTEHAIEFFSSFQATFEEEIHQLTAYASHDTVKLAWKDKILRNEKYHSKPKDGWTEREKPHRAKESNQATHSQEQEWSARSDENNDNVPDKHLSDNNSGSDRLTTFYEHQSQLRRSITMLLHCQIPEPRIRHHLNYGQHEQGRLQEYIDNDDHIEPEDVHSLAKYHSAKRLRDRVSQSQRDLLPLLDHIRQDNRHMAAALAELTHLASILETYKSAWRRPTSSRGRY